MDCNILHKKLESMATGYITGEFAEIKECLDVECTFETDWRTDQECGKNEVESYFDRKGRILKKYQVMPSCEFVKIFYQEYHLGEEALYIKQILDGKVYDAVLVMELNAAGYVIGLALRMKELFRMIHWYNEIAY